MSTANESSAAAPSSGNNNNNSNGGGGRGKGRGGGRGNRGRGRGRGGRGRSSGRGRGRSSSNSNSNGDSSSSGDVKPFNDSSAASHNNNNNNNNLNNNNSSSDHPPAENGTSGRGRGGRGRGRGGGRNSGRGRSRGRGRGGRGRGRGGGRHNNNTAKHNATDLQTSDELNGMYTNDLTHTTATNANATTTTTTADDHDEQLRKAIMEGTEAIPHSVLFGTDFSTMEPTSTLSTPATLSLPTPPRMVGGRDGAPMILTRSNNTTAAATTTSSSSAASSSQPQSLPPPSRSSQPPHAAAGHHHHHHVIDHESEAQKLSESMAAAALGDFDDHEPREEEKKESVLSEETSSNHYQQHSNNTATSNGHHHHQQQEQEQQYDATTSNSKEEQTTLAPATANSEKKTRKKGKKKKKDASATNTEEVPPTPAEEEPIDVSATDAIKALPAQEVSITATTKVQVRRTESSNSISKMDEGPMKITGTTGAKAKKTKSKKKKGLSTDDAANQRAAKAFNKSVRQCVERSDPDAMREILHDRRNHNFALDKNVLETVMKAYVMAAMFEDALYCLRNCTLPGTLSTIQTERILQCLPQNLRNSSAYTAADMINALCIASEFDNPTSRTYFMRIVRGISLEFLEEVMSARDRICSAPCERLVRSAVCVVDARLKRGKKPSDLIVDPGNQLGVFVPDSMENRGIQAGDAVSLLPYAGPYPMSAESLDRNMIEATVTNTNPMVLRLQDKANASLHAMLTENIDGNVYRIDKLANRMGFNRQLASAVAIASPLKGDTAMKDSRRPSAPLIKAITAMDENIDRVMNQSGPSNGGAFKEALTSTAALCAQAAPWNVEDESEEPTDEDGFRMASGLALEKYGALEGLNASQRLAVEGAVTNRLTLVQGPPGTGKTAVAIRILQHWARLAESNLAQGGTPQPILATSDSNIAVDNLVEGCAAVGLRAVRLGRPEAIRPELLRFCIDRPPSSYNNNNNNRGGNNQQFGNSGGAMAYKDRMKALKKAQIICCTCIGSGSDILDTMNFERVLVDEATQATEPAVLVPLMRGCRQLVLVGDHCQLPPTVLSTRAEEEGHGVPLFSRMVACGVPPFMLDTQYRMHPCIAMFPSDLFYGGKLLNGVSAPERRPLAGFPWPREEFPVAYVPVKGVEMDDGVSKMNEAEAAAACDAVAALLSGGQCSPSDIAVVTPYAAQARLIRRMTRRLTQNSGPPFIEVSSVDGFQGREKEAVVFSAVRSNDYGAIGFASDWRRVNVSFTRARRALIVIGNDTTLRRGDADTWMPWLAWADAHGLNMDKPGVPRGRYDPEQLRRVRGGTTAAEMLKDVLARQQAQLKTAQRQLQKAEKNAAGHIIGKEDDDEGDESGDQALSLEEDLARLTNTDGNWDDSDDENEEIHRSISRQTLTSATSSNNLTDSNDSGPVDVWDL